MAQRLSDWSYDTALDAAFQPCSIENWNRGRVAGLRLPGRHLQSSVPERSLECIASICLPT